MSDKPNCVQKSDQFPLIFEQVHFLKLVARGKKNYREACFDKVNELLKPSVKSYNTLKRWFLKPELSPNSDIILKIMTECLGRTLAEQYDDFTKNPKISHILESYKEMEESLKKFRNNG